MIDEHAATDLEQYINNTAELYPQLTSILKNLATKKARKEYKHDLAVKLFGYLVESGAKRYAKEFGATWHQMFNVPTRKAVAEELTKTFEAEEALGNYASLLPKKYQKPEKSPEKSQKIAHARKKVSWTVPEGLEVVWSPVNSAYFALWPAKRPRSEQQVLKVAGTDEMGSWLRERYGAPYGRGGSSRTHARKKSNLHTHLHEPGALRAATDRQLRGFYQDEKRDVVKARAEAKRRGFTLHAQKKSTSQLDREIAQRVPSWRGGR